MSRKLACCVAWLVVFAGSVATAQDAAKPNILVIWGDDIGTWNISHNSRGMMGYMTPNIDRIAREGVAFTDYDRRGNHRRREGIHHAAEERQPAFLLLVERNAHALPHARQRGESLHP